MLSIDHRFFFPFAFACPYLGPRIVAYHGSLAERIGKRQIHLEQFVLVQIQSKPMQRMRGVVACEKAFSYRQPYFRVALGDTVHCV